MEDKIKIIAIALGGVLLISLFMNFQTYSAKKALERERDDLRHENATLNKQVEEGRKEKQQLDDKIKNLSGELDKVNQQGVELKKDKEDLQKLYDQLIKEKKDLEEKLKAQAAKEKDASETKAALSPAEEAYWAKILKAKTDLEVQVDSLKSQLKAAMTDNNQLKREKSILEMDFNNINREKQDLDQQLNSIDSMSLELVKEKTAKLKTDDTLRFLKAENAVLRRQLKALSVYRSSLEKRLQKVQEDKVDLEKKFNEMEVLLENRLAQVGELKVKMGNIRSGEQSELVAQEKKEAIDLPPIVVYPKPGVSLQAQQDQTGEGLLRFGKVLSVNRENNFVVVDLGETSGVKVGDSLQVYRNGQPIANVEIIQARKGVSACDIKKEIAPIKADDLVR